MTRALLSTLLAALVVLLAPGAWAQTRVVVGDFEGDDTDSIRAATIAGLKARSEVRVIARDHASKVGSSLGASLSNAAGVRKVSSAVGLAGVLEGSVKEAKGTWTATLRLRSAKDGEVSETHKFRASDVGSLAEKVKSSVWKAVGPALASAPKPKAAGKKRVVVLTFTGTQSGIVRGHVVGALKKQKSIALVADKELANVELSGELSPDAISGTAGALDAAVLVSGAVTVEKGRYTLALVAYNGADGEALTELSFSGKGVLGLRAAIVKELGGKLAGAFDRASAPEPPEEETPRTASSTSDADAEVDEEEDESDSPTPGDGETGGRPSPLEVIVGARAISRDYRYSDDLFGSLRSYQLGVAPAAFIALRWYPVAHASDGPLSHVGLVGGYEQGFALKSQVEGGEELSTTMRQWYAGLRYRVPVDRHEVGVEASYGRHTFTIEDDPAAPLIPDVQYRFIRLGLDGRVRVAQVLIGAQLGYRILTGSGQLESAAWFPRASGGGLDAGFMAGYELTRGIALVAGFDFRRYFFSLEPQPGDPWIAGGAVDEYLSGWGGFAFRIPGDAD